VVTHSPLTPADRVQLPDAALSSSIQATIHSGSVKCVAISKELLNIADLIITRCGSALSGIKRVAGR